MKIGIIGTGRIAARFINESRTVPFVEITSIYNPRYESAVFFAERNGLDKTLVSREIEEFMSNVEGVYIATPHHTHVQYIDLALQNNKHVLCEKPLALSGEQAMTAYEQALDKGLILMEAVKTASCPGFIALLDLIRSGRIGQVHDISACFTKIGSASGREVWGEDGGSFLELGSYTLLPIVKLLGIESEESYIWTYDCVTGADSYTKTVVSYKDATATALTGLGVKSEGALIISGEKGYIRVPAPWWMTRHIEVHYENPNKVEEYDYPYEGDGLRYEILNWAEKCIAIDAMKLGLEDNQKQILDTVWNELASKDCVAPLESVWMACQMEAFLEYRKEKAAESVPEGTIEETRGSSEQNSVSDKKLRIWAHRGCSKEYPENTLLAFEKAAQIPGITGIETDIQLSKDGEIVVIHDETLDRTTTGTGRVVDYTLAELKEMCITASGVDKAYICGELPLSVSEKEENYCLNADYHDEFLRIPTLREMFDLLKPYCLSNGLMINIELKNSNERYEGMEEKVIALVAEYGLQRNIIYSSFNHESMGVIKELNPEAQTGILGMDVLTCIDEMLQFGADAIHPWNGGMGINPETVATMVDNNIPVRMWNGDEPLYGQSRILKNTDLEKYQIFGITDIITNVPELYL